MIPAAKDESETIQYKQVMSGFLHACEIAYYDMVQLEPSQRFYGIKVKEAHSNHMFF
jgi:hypothetical protein